MSTPFVQNQPLVILVIIGLLILQSPLAAYAIRDESPQPTQLLSDARDEALELASDANQMQALILSDEHWVTHALMLARVKAHMDNMALIIEKIE